MGLRRGARAALLSGAAMLTATMPVAAESDPAAAAHERGRDIYNFHCYFCHGYSGDAKTLTATYIEPKPRDFTRTAPDSLSREAMVDALTRGRPGTAMKPFTDRLDAGEIADVVDFVRREFMTERLENTRYHTVENGWPDHERYALAYPFAKGELPIEETWQPETADQAAGRRLFLAACVTCHDHGHVPDDGPVWDLRPLSYPRAGYSHRPEERIDATTSASPYAIHEIPPEIGDADPDTRRGEALFQENCAFCHGGDGTGKNWIGSFLEPHPRDLTDPQAMAGMTAERLRRTIEVGLPGTSMPAWRSVLTDEEIGQLIRYIDRAFHPVDGVDRG